MNIRDLKELIANLPDDMEVLVEAYEEGYQRSKKVEVKLFKKEEFEDYDFELFYPAFDQVRHIPIECLLISRCEVES